MTPQELHEYIQKAKAHGLSAEQISDALVDNGWDPKIVDDALITEGLKTRPIPQPTPVPEPTPSTTPEPQTFSVTSSQEHQVKEEKIRSAISNIHHKDKNLATTVIAIVVFGLILCVGALVLVLSSMGNRGVSDDRNEVVANENESEQEILSSQMSQQDSSGGGLSSSEQVQWDGMMNDVSDEEELAMWESAPDSIKKLLIKLDDGEDLTSDEQSVLMMFMFADGNLQKINPDELLEQSRDAQRMADIAAMGNAIGVYLADVLNDRTFICDRIYRSDERTTAVDGTGWLPIDFTEISSGSPLPRLPIDPAQDEGYVYEFACDKDSFGYELNAKLISEKYQSWSVGETGFDGSVGNNDSKYERGSNLQLID